MTQPSSLTLQPATYNPGFTAFDPLSPGFIRNPYPAYAALRERGPVYVPCHGSSGTRPPAWIVGHAAACALLTDARIQRRPISSELDNGHPSKSQSAYATMIGNWMLFQDAPSHTRQRASLGRIFTPPVVSAMRARIEQIANRALDTLLARGAIDLIRDFAFPLPVQVIASLLGLPARDCGHFKRWSTTLSDAIDLNPSADTLQSAENAVGELQAYFRRSAEQRLRNPTDDLLTTLVAQAQADQGLTEAEAFATFTLLLTAGHETTTNLIGNGMLALLANPEQLRHLREHPECTRTAIEEFLRYESPVQITSRIVSNKLDIEGHTLEPGQRVMIVFGAANRDPAIFFQPNELDICRSPNPHLTFGLGSHYCAGAPLARLQAGIAINTLIRRLPRLRIVAETLDWRVNASFRGLVRLPCVFD